MTDVSLWESGKQYDPPQCAVGSDGHTYRAVEAMTSVDPVGDTYGYFEIPSGYEAQIRARSGLAINHGIGVVNGIGTVDSDYRGEIKVPLINWSDEEFTIRNGDRIAQVVIAEAKQVTIRPVDELSDSERGTGGFGHTGI